MPFATLTANWSGASPRNSKYGVSIIEVSEVICRSHAPLSGGFPPGHLPTACEPGASCEPGESNQFSALERRYPELNIIFSLQIGRASCRERKCGTGASARRYERTTKKLTNTSTAKKSRA